MIDEAIAKPLRDRRDLFRSQPLHFGDYAGLPLKILWALLDIAAIVVLASGVYLWLGRRRLSVDRRVDELVHAGVQAGGQA